MPVNFSFKSTEFREKILVNDKEILYKNNKMHFTKKAQPFHDCVFFEDSFY